MRTGRAFFIETKNPCHLSKSPCRAATRLVNALAVNSKSAIRRRLLSSGLCFSAFFLLCTSRAFALFNGVHPPAKVAAAAAATFVLINDDEFLCSAVWIAPKVALTAAHCLANKREGGLLVRGTSNKSTKVVVDATTDIRKKTRTDDEAALDLAVVYFPKANAAATVPIAKELPLLSQPVVMIGWGSSDPNAKELEEKSLKQLYGTNSIASRPLARALLRVSADFDKRTSDGTNASTLPGDSGSGLFDEDAAAVAGIVTGGGLTPDKKKLIGSFVSLHSASTRKLFEQAAKDIGTDFPKQALEAVEQAARVAAANQAPPAATPLGPPPPSSTASPALGPPGTAPATARPRALALTPRPARKEDADFLVVDGALAKRLEDSTGVAIPPGIYRTRQEDAEWRADLRLPLVAEAIVDLPPYDGVERARVGYALDAPKELWLVTQTQLRYRLVDDKGKPAPFLEKSRHVVPLAKGVLHFDAEWRAKYRAYDKTDDLDLTVRAFLVAPRPKAAKAPVVLVDPSRERALLAHWEFELKGSFPDDADEPASAELSLFDPEQATAREPLLTLATSLPWPFFLRHGGVFRIDASAKKLLHRALDWARPALAAEREVLALGTQYDTRIRGNDFTVVRKGPQGSETALLIDADGRIAQRTGRRERFSPVDPTADGALAALTTEPPPRDLFAMPRPSYLYGSSRVNTALAKSLGGSRRTWAILVYEDGQRPEDVATAFLTKVASGAAGVGPSLAELQRAWKIPGGFLGVVKDADRLEDTMKILVDAFHGRRSLAFFPDFPVRRAEAVDLAVPQLETFWHYFEKCVDGGTCRVLTTMRADVYAELVKRTPTILSHATAIEVPKLEGRDRAAVAVLLRRALEHEYGRVLSNDAYDAVSRFGATTTSTRQAPQRDEDVLREFFDWAEEAAPRTTAISADVARRFVNRERTGVATGRAAYDIEKLRKHLLEKLVGQDAAIERVTALLKPVGNGTQFGPKPIFFVLLGTPGTGKTTLANLVADQLTGEGSNLLIDFKDFKGFDGDASRRVFNRLKNERRGLRVVTFDDVDRATLDDLDRLRGIFDNGYFAKGTANEVSFANTVVILTANWGEQQLLAGAAIDDPFFEKLRREVVHDDTKPNAEPNPRGKVSNRVWSALSGKMIALAPFKEEDLLKLALRFAADRAKQVKDASGGKELFVHPLVLAKLVSSRRAASSGARDLQNSLDADVYPAYENPIGDRNVRHVILVPSRGATVAVTDRDEHFRLWKRSHENALKVVAEKGAKWFLENADKWFAEDFKKLQGEGR